MQILSARHRVAALMAAAGLALAFSACKGSNTTPTPVPTPAPRITTTVFNQGYSVSAGSSGTPFIGVQDVNIPDTGDVVVAFDWTNPASDIDLVITSPSCTSGISAYNNQCTVHGSDKAFSKPARVSFTVVSPGAVRIFVYNWATVPESGVLSVMLTH
jgi:hypothetical protein